VQFRDRRAQFGSAFADCILESGTLVVQEQMCTSAFEKIANPQHDFDMVEWLKQKVGGAGLESASLRLFVGIGSKNNDGQKALVVARPNRFQNGEAIGRGHHQIK